MVSGISDILTAGVSEQLLLPESNVMNCMDLFGQPATSNSSTAGDSDTGNLLVTYQTLSIISEAVSESLSEQNQTSMMVEEETESPTSLQCQVNNSNVLQSKRIDSDVVNSAEPNQPVTLKENSILAEDSTQACVSSVVSEGKSEHLLTPNVESLAEQLLTSETSDLSCLVAIEPSAAKLVSDIDNNSMMTPACCAESGYQLMDRTEEKSDSLSSSITNERQTASSSGDKYSFLDLLPIPKRQRPDSKRQRRKLPSYHLTSDVHMNYVKESMNKKKKQATETTIESKRKQEKRAAVEKKQVKENERAKSRKIIQKKSVKKDAKVKKLNKGNSDEIWVCDVCNVQYGNPDDAKISEDWYPCSGCAKKFHDSCAQSNGVLDDGDVFSCKMCIMKTNN